MVSQDRSCPKRAPVYMAGRHLGRKHGRREYDRCVSYTLTLTTGTHVISDVAGDAILAAIRAGQSSVDVDLTGDKPPRRSFVALQYVVTIIEQPASIDQLIARLNTATASTH
jgi:hypothetical protein